MAPSRKAILFERVSSKYAKTSNSKKIGQVDIPATLSLYPTYLMVRAYFQLRSIRVNVRGKRKSKKIEKGTLNEQRWQMSKDLANQCRPIISHFQLRLSVTFFGFNPPDCCDKDQSQPSWAAILPLQTAMARTNINLHGESCLLCSYIGKTSDKSPQPPSGPPLYTPTADFA